MSNDPTKDPNITFRGRLGNHPVVKILVSGRASASKSFEESEAGLKAQPKDGPVLRRRPDDELIAKKKSGAINFFDMGQHLSGDTWVTYPYTVTPSISLLDNYLYPGPQSVPDLLTLAQVQAFETIFLAGSPRKVGKPFGNYFPITVFGTDDVAGSFSFDSTGSDTNWDTNGLKLTPSQLAGPNIAVNTTNTEPLYHYLELNDRTTNKVTTLPSYASPDVTFRLANGDKVYLSPMLAMNEGGIQAATSVFPAVYTNIFFNQVYTPWPRNFSTTIGEYYENNWGDALSANFNYLLAQSVAIRTQTATHYGNGDPADLVSGGAFPQIGLHSIHYMQFGRTTPLEGQLLGMVKRGSTTYYFWQLP